jgi:alkylation response protein AidB-like acyl-CoA dehydrogenase
MSSQGEQLARYSPLDRAVAVAPLIEQEAEINERAGQLTEATVKALKESDLFWMGVPRELGGDELDVLGQIEVIEEVSRADGSAGWTLMANGAATTLAAAGCSDEAVQTLFSHQGDRAVVGGMLGPAGRAEAVPGGWTVTGRYSFGSGVTHATWIAAGVSAPDSDAQMVAMVPRHEVRFLGNWNVLGLCGTGSVDYELVEAFVPDGFSYSRTAFDARRGGPSCHLGVPPIAAAGHAAVALGIAKRSFEELVVVVDSARSRPGLAPPGEQQLFQHDFVEREGRLRSGRAYVMETFEVALSQAEEGLPLSNEQAQRVRQAATVATRLAGEAVEFAYRWAGSVALREPNPIGRCMRDMHGVTQHVYVDPNSLVNGAPAILSSYRRARPWSPFPETDQR